MRAHWLAHPPCVPLPPSSPYLAKSATSYFHIFRAEPAGNCRSRRANSQLANCLLGRAGATLPGSLHGLSSRRDLLQRGIHTRLHLRDNDEPMAEFRRAGVREPRLSRERNGFGTRFGGGWGCAKGCFCVWLRRCGGVISVY